MAASLRRRRSSVGCRHAVNAIAAARALSLLGRPPVVRYSSAILIFSVVALAPCHRHARWPVHRMSTRPVTPAKSPLSRPDSGIVGVVPARYAACHVRLWRSVWKTSLPCNFYRQNDILAHPVSRRADRIATVLFVGYSLSFLPRDAMFARY